MSNLTQKFNSLIADLSAKIETSINRLDLIAARLLTLGTNAKLDALITATNNVATATNNAVSRLDSVIAATNAANGVQKLTDLNERAVYANYRLDQILDAVATGNNADGVAIVAAINDLRGIGSDNTLKAITTFIGNLAGPAPGKSMTDIHTKLNAMFALWDSGPGITPYNLMDAIYIDQATIKNGLKDTVPNAGNLFSAIRAMNDGIGGIPNNSLALTSVRGLLNSSLIKSGIAPNGGEATSVSTSTIATAGRRYIVWPAVPGITRSADGVQLTPQTSWFGLEVYIQSSAPACRLDDLTDAAGTQVAFSMNSWVALGSNHKLAWSVDASYAVVGYIRGAVPAGLLTYTWGPTELEPLTTGFGTRYYPITTKYPGLTWEYQNTTVPRMLVGDYPNWVVNFAGGGGGFAASATKNIAAAPATVTATILPGRIYICMQSTTANTTTITMTAPAS